MGVTVSGVGGRGGYISNQGALWSFRNYSKLSQTHTSNTKNSIIARPNRPFVNVQSNPFGRGRSWCEDAFTALHGVGA